MQLVAGRECGPCTVCCTIPPVLTPELDKPPNTTCPHCVVSEGCRIYDARPDVCRESFCGWRYYAELDEAWRPDLSGVLVLTEQDAPRSPSGRPGLKFVLADGDAPLQAPSFLGYVAALARRDVPVSISVPGPPGYWPVKAFLKQPLREALRTFDTGRIQQVLVDTVGSLRNGPFEKAD